MSLEIPLKERIQAKFVTIPINGVLTAILRRKAEAQYDTNSASHKADPILITRHKTEKIKRK